MRALEAFTAQNISATAAAFAIKFGGIFNMDTVATWGGGSVTLQRLGPDGTSWLTAATAATTNGSSGALYLPAGSYRFAIATATGVYINLIRVPAD